MGAGDLSVASFMDQCEDAHLILSTSLEVLPIGFLAINADGLVLSINRAAADILGYRQDGRRKVTWSELCEGKELRAFDNAHSAIENDPVLLALQQNRRVTTRVQILTLGIGRERWISMTATPVPGEGRSPIACVATLFDITDLKGMHDVLYHQATHDPLTGLANRLPFMSGLDNALARVRRGKPGGAVMALDLDKFKSVNDTMGHAAGDELLIKMAERLRREVRETDIVARFGGDEFNVLLQDIEKGANAAIAGQIVRRICESLGKPFTVQGRELQVTASLGVCFFPLDGMDEETLLFRADTAMYQAKGAGRNRWKFWTESPMQDEERFALGSAS